MPQRSIAAPIASWPAVKFRLTGTLPASDVATLASAPPTDAGSSRPTYRWPVVVRRITPASRSAAVSARANVSSWPVESAMQKADGRRFAASMKARPSVNSGEPRGYVRRYLLKKSTVRSHASLAAAAS